MCLLYTVGCWIENKNKSANTNRPSTHNLNHWPIYFSRRFMSLVYKFRFFFLQKVNSSWVFAVICTNDHGILYTTWLFFSSSLLLSWKLETVWLYGTNEESRSKIITIKPHDHFLRQTKMFQRVSHLFGYHSRLQNAECVCVYQMVR